MHSFIKLRLNKFVVLVFRKLGFLFLSELMLFGFMSLLLTVGQGVVSDICISKALGATWHPCSKKQESESDKNEDKSSDSDEKHLRRLLTFQDSGGGGRRVLAAAGYDKCAAKAC